MQKKGYQEKELGRRLKIYNEMAEEQEGEGKGEKMLPGAEMRMLRWLIGPSLRERPKRLRR